MFENKEAVVGQESIVKVAAVQLQPELGNVEANVQKGIDMIKEAAAGGAKIIVLPELSTCGYVFNCREEAFAVAEPVPEGPTVKKWEAVAAECGVYIVAGIPERDGDKLYNICVLVGPNGYMGRYRKLHLWDREKLWFEPGDEGTPVFDTPYGRIAMMICYDMWHQEMWRIYGAVGADIVACPTNFPCIPGLPDEMPSFGPANCLVGCYDNGLSAILANRIGEERGLIFPGLSMVVSTLGQAIDGVASRDQEEIKYGEVNLMDSRRLHWTEFAGLRQDRRYDVYDLLCGADGIVRPY